MPIHIYQPVNLDFDKLMEIHPPNFKKYQCKKEKLQYIIHLIITRPFYNKALQNDPYVYLSSKLLQKIMDNYKEYLDYLIDDLKVIETDGFYVKGMKSKGYRLTAPYLTKRIRITTIKQITIEKNIRVHEKMKQKTVRHLPHITKWFNPKLTIDFDAVAHYMKEITELKLANHHLLDYEIKTDCFGNETKHYKEPMCQYNLAMISAQKIVDSDFSLSSDTNVNRFHSNLSNMKGVLRNALRYDGETLVSIDLKNSQPYLITLLLNPKFWISKKVPFANTKTKKTTKKVKPHELNKGFNKDFISNNKGFNNSDINITIDTLIKSKIDFTLMLRDIVETLMNKDFSEYNQLVQSGEFYEHLRVKFYEKLGYTFPDRDAVKKMVYVILFTDNRYLGQNSAKTKKLFKELFPDVYEVFSIIKKNDKTRLPKLLQSIESHLMIDVITKRIATEYPDAPIFPIHDSIATTARYAEAVEQIIKDELTKATGFVPTLKIENWGLEALNDSLEKIRERVLAFAS